MNETPEPNLENGRTPVEGKSGRFALGFYLFAGVILPVAALVAELGWQICSENFSDPVPTWWHVLLVAFVPVTNLQMWYALRVGETKRPGWLSFANGVAIFISLYYALVFAPLIPLAVIAIIVFLLGLLPLAPLLSLIAGIVMRWKMKPLLPSHGSSWFQWKALAGALLFVVVVIGISELSFVVTRLGVAKANSTDEATRNEGLSMLRKYGDTDYLLRLCYDGTGVVSPFMIESMLFGKAETGEHKESIRVQAQKAFYRVTGKSYRQVPSPRGIRHWDRIEASNQLDPNGKFHVNSGLSVSLSQMDGSVDGDAALGYLEWTIVFKNDEPWMQEALSEIQLPADAVVSRLTLWINGEEREAAFGKSAKVVEAYNAVTATRRDPALVTLIGKDRVQLKCFPVPANGEMKVRLGITIPVQLDNKENGSMTMPYFQDRNFVIASENSIWIESKQDIESPNQAFRYEKLADRSGLKGRVTDDDLSKGLPVRIARSAQIDMVWAKDTLDDGMIVKQQLLQTPVARVNKFVFVVDTSVAVADFQTEIAEAVRGLSPELNLELLLAGGNGLNGQTALSRTAGSPNELADMIASAEFGGGTDSVPVLERAMELREPPGTVIIWVHGPQTVELEPIAQLTRLWERDGRPQTPLYSLQVGPGRHIAGRALIESGQMVALLKGGVLSQDIRELVSKLTTIDATTSVVRTVETGKGVPRGTEKQTSQHLVRLWANDEVNRLVAAGDETKAISVALKNQLVTRVSGAVVLETQEQYDQFGLKPVDPKSVPTIPEPEEYLLFAIVALVLAYFGWRSRKRRLIAI